MVRTENFVVDFCGYDSLLQIFRNYKIVDTPARIPCTGVHSVGPPGIFHFFRMLETPAVNKACSQKLAELASLLVAEACIEMVR